MERSLDSIGHCPLSADAGPGDISDFSESPICHTSQHFNNLVTSNQQTSTTPSYLNIACSVNGYSNLTTYDSKIRQDIKKLREESTMKPVTTVKLCKKYVFGVPENTNMLNGCLSCSITQSHDAVSCPKAHCNNETSKTIGDPFTEANMPSLIQQRVERLFGKSDQKLYSPKSKLKIAYPDPCAELREEDIKKNKVSYADKVLGIKDTNRKTSLNVLVDLPVLRHLSEEFRVQLSTIAPKIPKDTLISQSNAVGSCESKDDNCAHGKLNRYCCVAEVSSLKTNGQLDTPELHSPEKNDKYRSKFPFPSLHDINKKKMESDKNGSFFLNVLKLEQDRLLSLAYEAENYNLTLTQESPEVSEEILGLLRSASGNARLLVSQKMKQFEGLCHKNINRSTEDIFPTTNEDLQGFWDMVCLQIQQVDTVFREIDNVRANGWKLPEIEIPSLAGQHTKYIKCDVRKTTVSKTKEKNLISKPRETSEAGQRREAQRKQLKELKRKNKISILSLAQSSSDSTNSSNIFLTSNVS